MSAMGKFWINALATVLSCSYLLANEPVSSQSGRWLTQAADGRLEQGDNGWRWSPDGEGAVQSLPAAKGDFQPVTFPFVKGPMAISASELVWWQAERWVMVPALARLERTGFKNRLGSFHGAKIIFPHVVTVGKQVWLYQAADGTLAIYDRDGQSVFRGKVKDDLRPVSIGDHLFWFNAPDEGNVSRNAAADQFKLAETERIRDLNKYSPVYATGAGVWILTFPMGFTDSLDAWDKGAIEVHANFLTFNNDSFQVSRWSLGELPLRFNLGVRTSGSPKLEVEAAFTGHVVRAVQGGMPTTDLAIVLDEHALVVTADRGVVSKLKAPPAQNAKIWLDQQRYGWQRP